jgi:hypothetical protein
MDLSNGQIKSLIVLGIGVLILILLNVFGKRGSNSDWDADDFDID